MDCLNHLREQSTDTFIDKILEEMYGILVIQIHPEFLFELSDSLHEGKKGYICHLGYHFQRKCMLDKLATTTYLRSCTVDGRDTRNI